MLADLVALPTRVSTRLEDGGQYPRWVLWVALTGLFATTFPITVLSVAIPTIARDLGTSNTTLAWVITLPTICSALALPVLGKLGDLYGHRRVFLIGFAVSTVTTALTATATSALTLIAWRTLTQVVGGATQPSSLALINSVYPPARRAKAMGWWSMIAALAPVIGLVVGGLLIEALGWQVVFLVQAGFMVVPVLAAWLVLRETPRRPAQFDVAGAVWLSLAVAGVMFPLSKGADWGVAHPVILGCLLVAPVGVWGFLRTERRAPAPLLPLEFFARRDFSSAVVASFLSSGAYMGGYFMAALMMRELFAYGEAAAAGFLIVRPLMFALSSPVGGTVAHRRGNRFGAVAGCLALAAGLAGLALGAALESILVVVLVGFVLQGVGYGLLRPPIPTALANSVDQDSLGVAAAAERLMGQMGFAFGVTALVSVYGGVVEPGRFTVAFGVAVVLALLAAVASSFMHRGPVLDSIDPLRELAVEETGGNVPVGERVGTSTPPG